MTERIFLPWVEPLLPQAARLLVERYAGRSEAAREGEEARMDGAVVVLPGSRAGRRLKELLLEESRSRGLRLVPPRIVTQGILPELLYEARLPLASGTMRRLVWAEALRDVAASAAGREELTRMFAALPGGGGAGRAPLGDWTPLARELAQLARTVAAGGYRFREVADRCGGSLLYDDAPRWRALARVQERVEARLGELGFLDRDLARVGALDAGSVALPGEVWLVGVAEMTGALRQLLAGARGGPLRILVHAPRDREHLFDELGCILPGAWEGMTLPLREEQIRVVDRPGQQAEAVARILEGLAGAYSVEEISLGVPSHDVVPALEQRLPKSGVRVRDAAGSPLSASGPYRLLRAAADFLGDRRYEALAAMARHPDLAPALKASLGNGALPADWLTGLDRWYNRHLPWPIPRNLPSGGEGREVASARAVVVAVDGILDPLDGDRAPLSRWVEPVLRFLARVYGPHRLVEEREPDRTILRALAEIRWAAESLARIPGPLDAHCDASTAVRFILEEAAAVRLPDPARDDAVEMLGWLELHLDDTPATIVTGVNEGALPESVRGDAFLPDALRSLLRLEDNRQRHARDVYRMTALLHSRKSVYLVSGRRTAEGDPLRPSRLLFAADDATVVRRVARFYGEDVAEGGGVPPGADRQAEARESGFRLPPEPVIPLEGVPESLSVTDFRRLLADPYEWALARLRGLEILEDRTLEMDGGVFGSLAHDVLQAFGRAEVDRHAADVVVTDPSELWKELERLLDRRVAAQFGPRASLARVAVRLQVEQLRSRLRAFADWHADWVSRGWRMRGVELSASVPFPYQDGHASVLLRARIDRVDDHPGTGSWAVFDYKTSDSGHDPEKAHRKGRGEGKEWVDLQLPLYHWLATRLVAEDGTPLMAPGTRPEIRLGFIVLPRDLDQVGARMADWDEATLESGVERARRVIRGLAEGPIRFDPAYRPRYPEAQMEALVGRTILAADEGEEEEA